MNSGQTGFNPGYFNVRVYGLLLNELGEVLLSDERRFNHSFTKFPGGGLEWGEELTDGLKREFEEELGISVETGELFYVNDFFQVSAFQPDHQLLCFYYFVRYSDWKHIEAGKHQVPVMEDGEKHRWVAISALNPGIMTFPIDKIVASMLANFPLK